MKIDSQITKLFLLVAISAGIVFNASAQNNTRKGRNLSIGISKTDDSKIKTNYFNIGLTSNYQFLKGASINVISDVAQFNSQGIQLSGFVNITGSKSYGLQMAGLANVTRYKAYGLRIGGLMNISGHYSSGVQISGLGNISGKSHEGLMVTGLINMSSQEASGVQIAGLSNISGNKQKGVSIAGLTNVSGSDVKGIQITSLLNIAGKSNYGVQLSALGNISIINKGLQLGLISNYSDTNSGVQLGLSNISSKSSRSLQVGILNISNDSSNVSRQIGLINFKPHTRTQLIISSGNMNKLSAAVRFKNRIIYTQLGAGLILGNLTDKASVSATYRTGLSFPVIKNRFNINTDIGYSHIETLSNRYIPERLYSLTPRVEAELSLNNNIGIFASGGYSWTRTYKGNKSFSNDTVFELGFIIF